MTIPNVEGKQMHHPIHSQSLTLKIEFGKHDIL